MAKATGEKQINSFVRGLITEASPLTYPDNASLDEANFVLNRNGSRARRLGLDYEDEFALVPTGFTQAELALSKVSSHKWTFPGGDTTVNIQVIRVGDKLWFLDTLTANPSNNPVNNGNPLTISGLGLADIEADVINGLFIVTSSDLPNPILLSYAPTTGLVSQETISIKVRDIWGIDDGLGTTERPITLSNEHRYNLRNQGWNKDIASVCNAGTDDEAMDCTFSTLGYFPSNADIWTLGKVGDGASPNFEKYDPNKLIKNSYDNSSVSRGAYIIDAFDRGTDRISQSGIIDLPLDRENGRISSVASYAGRVFYSGVVSSITDGDVNSPNYTGYVFFTQTIKSKNELSKCYQEADPTSPDISDIIDTDGGTIQIPEASRIYKILPSKASLLVFADNGVWEIYGDAGGFKATSFQLSKVSSVGMSAKNTVINANGTVVYWSRAGIYALVQDATTERYSAQNISLLTIQTLFNELSDVTKDNARGFFDERENQLRWLYNDTADYNALTLVNKYNKELVLDLTLQAFYINSTTVSATLPYLAGYIETTGTSFSRRVEDVFVGVDIVQVLGEDVGVGFDVQDNRIGQYSFLVFVGTSFTVALYRNQSFLDWVTFDGIGTDYQSFLVTGYDTSNDLMRMKQAPYAFFFFERTEDGYGDVGGFLELTSPSGCFVQSQWNWADSANSGKWGTTFQAYRLNRHYLPSGPFDTLDYGERVIVTKNKLRGRGRCLSLKITSETGKDLRLLGWALSITGNASP